MSDAITEGRAARNQAADALFQAVLQHDSSKRSTASNHAATPDHLTRSNASAVQGRLRSRRVQLSNPDRPMPKAAEGSNQARKLAKRKNRTGKRWRETLKAELKRDKGFVAKERDLVKKGSRRPKAVKLALGEAKVATSEALLNMTHTLWVKYVQNLLNLQTAISQATIQEQIERHCQDAKSDAQNVTGPLSTSAPTALSKADLNGASLKVVDSTNESLKGLQGIVVQETEQTIMLGTPTWMETGTLKEKKRHRKSHAAGKQRGAAAGADGQEPAAAVVEVERNPVVRQIPKHETIFVALIPLPPASSLQTATAVMEMELYGNQMRYVLAGRATRKAKQKRTIELAAGK